MKRTKKAKHSMGKAIVKVAKKAASLEANTACFFWGYQPKEPFEVQRLRKF